MVSVAIPKVADTTRAGAHRFAARHRGDTLLCCHLFVSLNLTPFRTEGNVCRVARYAAFPCKRGLIKTASESYIQ